MATLEQAISNHPDVLEELFAIKQEFVAANMEPGTSCAMDSAIERKIKALTEVSGSGRMSDKSGMAVVRRLMALQQLCKANEWGGIKDLNKAMSKMLDDIAAPWH